MSKTLVYCAFTLFSLQALAIGASAADYHYVANTEPPDAYLSLRTAPTTKSGQRITTMPNGTLLEVSEKRPDGWWLVKIVSTSQVGWTLSTNGAKKWIECCKVIPEAGNLTQAIPPTQSPPSAKNSSDTAPNNPKQELDTSQKTITDSKVNQNTQENLKEPPVNRQENRNAFTKNYEDPDLSHVAFCYAFLNVAQNPNLVGLHKTHSLYIMDNADRFMKGVKPILTEFTTCLGSLNPTKQVYETCKLKLGEKRTVIDEYENGNRFFRSTDKGAQAIGAGSCIAEDSAYRVN